MDYKRYLIKYSYVDNGKVRKVSHKTWSYDIEDSIKDIRHWFDYSHRVLRDISYTEIGPRGLTYNMLWHAGRLHMYKVEETRCDWKSYCRMCGEYFYDSHRLTGKVGYIWVYFHVCESCYKVMTEYHRIQSEDRERRYFGAMVSRYKKKVKESLRLIKNVG